MLRFIDTQLPWGGEPIDDIRHPRTIEKLWTDEELNAIGLERVAADNPAPPDRLDVELTRRELRLGLLSMGLTESDVVAAINEEPDPVKREAALIEWQDNFHYNFNHPLVGLLMARLSMDEEQAKTAWRGMVEQRP